MSDSLKRDEEDLPLKFSPDGDFKINGELDVATRQRKLMETLSHMASSNSNYSVRHNPGKRQRLYVIDCYNRNERFTEILTTIIKKCDESDKIQFKLNKICIVDQFEFAQESIKARGFQVNLKDFDALACNSRREYYP